MGDDDVRAGEISAKLRAAVGEAAVHDAVIDALGGALAAIERLQGRLVALEGESLKAVEALVGAMNLPLVRSAAPEPPQLPKITVSADMIHLPNDGFYPVEYTPGGKPYRWTGANGGSFGWSLHLDRTQERTAVLELMPQGHARPQDHDALMAFVDGMPVRAERRRDSDRLFFEATLPATIRRAPTDLRFQTPVWVPKEVRPPSKDERRLGVAILSLTVE
jgi:hypothetical protein